MSGEVTVGDGELCALSAAFDDLGASTRQVRARDAVAQMSGALPGSHVSWVAEHIASVLDGQISAAGQRLVRLGDAARTSGSSYERSDAVPAYLFDRLGR